MILLVSSRSIKFSGHWGFQQEKANKFVLWETSKAPEINRSRKGTDSLQKKN